MQATEAEAGAIQRIGPQRPVVAPMEFTPDQRKMILTSFLNGASEQEAMVLMELARLRRLNPITKQIHFVKRWDRNRRAEVWSAQVGIDGFRAIAERTGLYDGQDEPECEYDNIGALKCVKVKVYRKDWSRPAVGVAHFPEYAQYTKEGGLTHMWATKPHVMLSKCAEALAMRKAFPEDMSGLYTAEEMGDDRPPEKDVTPPVGQGKLETKKTQILPPPAVETGKTGTSPTAEEAKAKAEAVAILSRAQRLWNKAKAAHVTAEMFQGWTAQILGHAKKSSQWTIADLEALEAQVEGLVKDAKETT